MALFGGIESGGTKWICAIGDGDHGVQAEFQFSTTTPEATLGHAIEFFRSHEAGEPIAAIGISSFGPVDPDPRSATYGYVTTTPKAGWAHTDVVGPIRAAFGVPVGFDTDVNGAALGEYRWGAAQGLHTFLYVTVGTGLGGGGMVNGELMHGLMHPEVGHMALPHDWEADPYAGHCPYHGDCWEGLAAGPAIEDRWQFPAEQLPPGHPSWHLEAHYLAQGLRNLICVLSPQRIIMGGGVMKQSFLFPMIRDKVKGSLNGYIQRAEILDDIDHYIVPPDLGDRAGVLGALALAEVALKQNERGESIN